MPRLDSIRLSFVVFVALCCFETAHATTLSVVGPDGFSTSFAESEGTDFQVAVSSDSYTDLYAWQFDLNWNAAILSLETITEGTALSSAGATFFVPGLIDNTDGSAIANADTLVGAISGSTGTGQVLAYFNFTAIGPGVTSISLANVMLLDSDLDNIEATSAEATATITGATAVPEPAGIEFVALGLCAFAVLRLIHPRPILKNRSNARVGERGIGFLIFPVMILGPVATVFHPSSALAQQTTYTFSSVPFNSFSGLAGCPPTCRLTGSFTLANPLQANLVSAGIGGAGDFLPLSFKFTDGLRVFDSSTFTPQLGSNVGFSADTDQNGSITQFSFYINPNGVLFAYYGGTTNDTQLGVNYDGAYFFGEGARAGGWTIRYSQAGSPWGTDTYDDFAGKTMQQKGCAVTSLAMALDIAGTTYNVFIDPGDLNDFMTTDGDFTPQHNVDWQGAINGVSEDQTYNPSLKPLVWNGLNITTADQLATALDLLAESIVVGVPAIKNCTFNGGVKRPFCLGHWQDGQLGRYLHFHYKRPRLCR